MPFMPETATEPVRQSEVNVEFARVEECTGYIDKIISELEERLGRSILAQHKPSGAGSDNQPSAPEPIRVPLAQSLFEHGTRLERIRERLSSILSRIEA
jgi:hypothetical protein